MLEKVGVLSLSEAYWWDSICHLMLKGLDEQEMLRVSRAALSISFTDAK